MTQHHQISINHPVYLHYLVWDSLHLTSVAKVLLRLIRLLPSSHQHAIRIHTQGTNDFWIIFSLPTTSVGFALGSVPLLQRHHQSLQSLHSYHTFHHTHPLFYSFSSLKPDPFLLLPLFISNPPFFFLPTFNQSSVWSAKFLNSVLGWILNCPFTSQLYLRLFSTQRLWVRMRGSSQLLWRCVM